MAVKKEKPKNRTVYYFRCEFAKIDGVKVKDTLEVMTNTAWGKLNSTEERTFYIGDDRSSYADFWCMEEKGSCGVIC